MNPVPDLDPPSLGAGTSKQPIRNKLNLINENYLPDGSCPRSSHGFSLCNVSGRATAIESLDPSCCNTFPQLAKSTTLPRKVSNHQSIETQIKPNNINTDNFYSVEIYPQDLSLPE